MPSPVLPRVRLEKLSSVRACLYVGSNLMSPSIRTELRVASLPQSQWHTSSFCQRKLSFIRLHTDLPSVSQASSRPKFRQTSCCSAIVATLKTYCTPCTPIWARVSGLPLTSDDFAANSPIQRRGLSTSRIAIQIQLY